MMLSRIVETARLMVGVGSYQKYVEHMRQHHGDVKPMTETEYFRYCQNSRYPGTKGQINKCPC